MSRVNRISVAGLRTSDATNLFVLTQDLFLQSIIRLEGQTLADVFALAELPDQLPVALARDSAAFVRAKIRELNDLPDGEHLKMVFEGLIQVSPEKIPANLREALIKLQEREHLVGQNEVLLHNIIASWAAVEPEVLVIPKKSIQRIQRPAVPQRLQMPEDEVNRPTKKVKEKEKKPEVAKRATAAAQIDQERAVWIRKIALQKLDNNREKGLKENILVASVVHKEGPFKNITDSEVRSELRALSKEGQVQFSAGRWSLGKRLGW